MALVLAVVLSGHILSGHILSGHCDRSKDGLGEVAVNLFAMQDTSKGEGTSIDEDANAVVAHTNPVSIVVACQLCEISNFIQRRATGNRLKH